MKAVLIFQDLKISQLKSLKNFSKESCSFILGNGNPETIPGIFSKETFFIIEETETSKIVSENKTFSILQERNFQNPGTTDFSHISGNGAL